MFIVESNRKFNIFGSCPVIGMMQIGCVEDVCSMEGMEVHNVLRTQKLRLEIIGRRIKGVTKPANF